MSRLVVLDALGLAYRAYYAFIGRPLRNERGENTSAIFGFANIAMRLRRELQPDLWALAWDGPGRTFRHELYPEYKAHRPPMPEDLSAQLSPIEDLAQAIGLPVVEKEGMEADDVMATLARLGAERGDEVILVTGDKDMLQVVGEHVTVLAPAGKGEDYVRMDPGRVADKWGVGPGGIRDVLALMGDSSDNIPGVAGIGEKTAVELMKTFGSLEVLYERLDEVKKPALHRRLVEHRAEAFLSRELATVQEHLDLGLSLESLKAAPVRRDELLAFARRWGIRRLEVLAESEGVPDDAAGTRVASRDPARRGTAAEQRGTGVPLREPEPRSRPSDPFDSRAIARATTPLPAALIAPAQGALDLWATPGESADAAATLDAFAVRLHAVRARSMQGLALLPVLEDGDPRRATLVGLALASRDGTACYVPLAHEPGPNLPADRVREWLSPALADPACPLVAHDLKRVHHAFEAAGLPLQGAWLDLHLASFLCDPARDHGLPALAADVLGVPLGPLEPPVTRGRGRPGFAAWPAAAAAAVAERHAAAMFPLAEALRAQLEARDQWKLYRDLEHPLIDVLWRMEQTGIALDVSVLREMAEQAGAEIAALETELHALAGGPVNLASGPQLAKVLFETLGLKPTKKTKTGWSTDSEVLEGLAGSHPFPRKLLEWRTLTKLKSTYFDALPAAVDPADGRVHTTYEQTGAATGRLSSSDPNLQNIPMRTPQGRAIRRAFVAAPGCLLVGADYSQIELRVMAHLSGDPALVDAFTSGEDVHASTARRIFKVEGPVDPGLRARAKVVNFGVMYGMGSRSLAQQMGIPLEEAKAFIDGYFEEFAGVRAYLDRTVAEARERGYVETLLGRRRWLPALRSAQGLERSNAERAAINTPIQGSAADLVKLAMLRVQGSLARGTARLLLQVHDELVLECRSEAARGVSERVRREMEHCFTLRVPLTVSVGMGATWYDIH